MEQIKEGDLYLQRLAYRALLTSTVAFTISFAVWTLYAVLGLKIQETLEFNSTKLGLLLAAPVLTGALFRIPAGWLSDNISPRRLLLWLQALLILPLLALSQVSSYQGYLLAGLGLGIAGCAFPVGVRYVSAWFSGRQQGLVLGIFGAGNIGAAVTFSVAPVLEQHFGLDKVGPLYALAVGVVLLLLFLVAPEFTAYMQRTKAGTVAVGGDTTQGYEGIHGGTRQANETFVGGLSFSAVVRNIAVWRFGLYHYFVFGSFLALLMWLPHYCIESYQMSMQQAMLLTLSYVVASSMARAIGGWMTDRYGGKSISWGVFWTCLVCLFFLSYPPTTMIIHGVNQDVQLKIEMPPVIFAALIMIIGIAQGFGRASVTKGIFDHFPNHMGAMAGVIAAIGTTGGFTLPLLFGLAEQVVGVYSACFMVLYAVLAGCMGVMYFANQADEQKRRLAEARANNFLE